MDSVHKMYLSNHCSDEEAAVRIKAMADHLGSVEVLWGGWWFLFDSDQSEAEILKEIKADGG